MSEAQSSSKKYILAGTAILFTLGILYYLSQEPPKKQLVSPIRKRKNDKQKNDQKRETIKKKNNTLNDQIKFDPLIHTEEKLKNIVYEIFLENSILACQKLYQIRVKKQQNKWDKNQLNYIKQQFNEENFKNEEEIYQENNITKDFLIQWLTKHSNDLQVKQMLENISYVKEQVFNEYDQKVDHIQCINIPKNLDENTYVLIYRKQYQLMRHELFNIFIQNGWTGLIFGDQNQTERLKEVSSKRSFFQKQALNLYDIKLNEGAQHQLLMRAVYLDFVSKSLKYQEKDEKAVIFSQRIQTEQNEHQKILNELLLGKDCSQYLRKDKEDNIRSEGGNGIQDIALDPLKHKETQQPSTQNIFLNQQ